MARDRPAHDRQRCLGPSALGDACLHDARFGGSRALPPPPASIVARLLSAAAKNTAWTLTATTQPRAQLSQVQPRRTSGWYLSLALCFARLDTRSAHTTWGHGKRRPTARRRGDPQLHTRPSGQPEPGLRPQHHPSPLIYGSSGHPLQNGRLTHTTHRTSTRLCILQRSAR
jgi:hypothetical protein